MNAVLLIGNMARDPEMRYVASGHPMAQFTVAVDRDFTNGDGERDADFIQVIAWRKLAEIIREHGRRGRLVGVQGRLQSRSYETSDGSRRRVTEVCATAVRFLDHPPQADSQATPVGRPATEQVPS